MTLPVDPPPEVIAAAKAALPLARRRRLARRLMVVAVALALAGLAVPSSAGASHIKWVTPMYGTPSHLTQ